MITAHFQDTQSVTRDQIAEVISSGRTPVVQFDRPPDEATMARVNDYCIEFGPELQVRFYGFGWLEFDSSLLRSLPDVANLSIDTVRAMSDISMIAGLSRLTRLRFGVHEHPDGRFLEQLDLGRFTHLSLAENQRRNFDLSILSAASRLEQLFIRGHWRGVEAIAGLPLLSDVSLSGFPKRHDLAFLNGLASLRSLLLILGSRASIAEFAHPRLQTLRIVWVRQLEELGPLHRFAQLSDLALEDQRKITRLDVSGLRLRRLMVANCKTLTSIIGLDNSAGLEQLSVPPHVNIRTVG